MPSEKFFCEVGRRCWFGEWEEKRILNHGKLSNCPSWFAAIKQYKIALPPFWTSSFVPTRQYNLPLRQYNYRDYRQWIKILLRPDERICVCLSGYHHLTCMSLLLTNCLVRSCFIQILPNKVFFALPILLGHTTFLAHNLSHMQLTY